MQWFEVALCRRWPPPMSAYFPEHIGLVEACSPFAAIEVLMRSCGLSYVAYTDAFAVDGSIHYRCYKLVLGEGEEDACL